MDALFSACLTDCESNTLVDVRVKVLVTFGCPLAVVRCLWPRSIGQYGRRHVHVQQWYNFVEERDPLGSELLRLIKKEGIRAKVCDYKFTFRNSKMGTRIFPHHTYWSEAEKKDCPPLQLIADRLARVEARNRQHE